MAAFQCLQPFVGTLLAFAVLGEEPSVWDVGAVGIFAGLYLIVSDRKDLLASNPVVSGVRRILSQQSLAALALPSFHRAPPKPKGAGKLKEDSV